MRKILCGLFALALLTSAPAWAQDNSAGQQAVSRQEFEDLKKQNDEMRQELAQMKQIQAALAAQLAQQNAATTQPSTAVAGAGAGQGGGSDIQEMRQELNDVKKQQTEQASNAEQDAEDYDKQLKTVQDQINAERSGLEGFTIVGDANVGFAAQRKSDSTFFADVSPLILWQPPDSRWLVQYAFDLEIGGSDQASETTSATMELGDISYEVNDYLMLGGGLFEVPFGQYHNHFDPPWIDKFPDDPLAFDALSPISEVGVYAEGAIPSGTTRWTYDVYAANGPNLITDDPGAAGQLNFTDLNNHKAVGGRIGFLPFPDMETGYSAQYSRPNPHGFEDVYALLQAADFHWKPLVRSLDGQFDFAAEWIWSKVDNATYDPTGGDGFGPIDFNNYRQGGYVSLGYRPTEDSNKILRNLEFLVRYDSLQTPLASPGGDHESRVSFGIDYWFTSYIVAKTAYEIDDKKLGPNQNEFIVQLGIGL
jgi:hypothetical protein